MLKDQLVKLSLSMKHFINLIYARSQLLSHSLSLTTILVNSHFLAASLITSEVEVFNLIIKHLPYAVSALNEFNSHMTQFEYQCLRLHFLILAEAVNELIEEFDRYVIVKGLFFRCFIRVQVVFELKANLNLLMSFVGVYQQMFFYCLL